MTRLGIAVVTAFGVLAPMADAAAAVKETVIHKFHDGSDGATPWDGVLIDSKGNVYGTTQEGGTSADENGTVFMLTPPASGTGAYTETIIHRFHRDEQDGGSSITSLIMSFGALYGTTQFGGTTDSGTVFEMKPPASSGGAWTEKVIYSFKGTADGETPDGAVVADAKGHLYGTTASGGDGNNDGVVYELTPNAAKTAYTFKVIYKFKGGIDGTNPESNLLMDAKGALYGTTANGGKSGNGLVFKLTPNSAKTVWTKTALHLFSGDSDGMRPQSGVVMDSSGNLYGTTYSDNSNDSGLVYRLKPNAAKTAYAESILYRFTGEDDGDNPFAGVVLDKNGNLYGATVSGGGPDNGVVFKLTPNAAKSAYKFSVLHAFSNNESGSPFGTPVLDKNGALWGTAQGDDNRAFGSVCKITQ